MIAPTNILVKRTRRRQTTHTVVRETRTQNNDGSFSTSETSLSRMLDLYGRDERLVQTDTGERHVGMLEGMKLPSVDVTYGDKVQYDSDLYELESIEHVPNEDSPSVQRLEFTRIVEGT